MPQIRVEPDIRQCRIIQWDIWYSGKKMPDIRQSMPDNPSEYPESGKKKIRPNPSPNTLMIFKNSRQSLIFPRVMAIPWITATYST